MLDRRPDRRTVVTEAYDLPNGQDGIPLRWTKDHVILGEMGRWQTWKIPIASLSIPRSLQGDGTIGYAEWREKFGKERVK